MYAADHRAHLAVARPGAGERIDDCPEAERAREHAEEAPDGDRPARRPPPMPLAPEHWVAVERRRWQPTDEPDERARARPGRSLRPTRRLPLAGVPDDPRPDPPGRRGGQQRRGQEPEHAEP